MPYHRRISIRVPDGTFCAPGNQQIGGTCFDRNGLLRLIQKYNTKYPDRAIHYTSKTPNRVLWSAFRDGLASVCGDNEWCWLDQDFLKYDSEIQRYYRPPRPNTSHKWLSTTDIDAVLKQYETQYHNFVFMGAVPLDFDEVIDEYRNMKICPMYQGQQITQFGFVFNLDTHQKKGSHWVSMFMNLDGPDKFIGFFDSYGHPPPPQIRNLIIRLKQQVKDCLGLQIHYKCNTVQHQHKNTECGVYSLYFIYQCLQHHTFEDITEAIILDDDVNRFREFFFRPTIHYRG
uniref:Ubiquitin-like protease family profile domain-containing protein n=1 Tax=viral metagenome TaxID=1070528 RepID=A0A6C0BKT3_9ZZZZ